MSAYRRLHACSRTITEATRFEYHGGQTVTAPGWWQPFTESVPSWFATYLTLETTATRIRSYEPQYLPGLFQTADYARAVIRLAHNTHEIEHRVELRQARQRLLDQAGPPTVQAVITEAAIRQPPLAPPQQRAQLDHLIALSRRPYITLQIAPARAAGAALADAAFTILHFNQQAQPDLVYVEQLDDAQYLDDPAAVEYYGSVLDDLSATCTPADQTASILRQLRAQG